MCARPGAPGMRAPGAQAPGCGSGVMPGGSIRPVFGTEPGRRGGGFGWSSVDGRTIGWPAMSCRISSALSVSYSSRPLAMVCRSSMFSVRMRRASVSPPSTKHRVAEEDLLLVLAVAQGAELVAHAPLRDHAAGEVGRLADVVGGAGRDIVRRRRSAPRRPGRPTSCRCAQVSSLLASSRSGRLSGRRITMPSARPRGMMVALCSGSCAGTFSATRRGRPRDRRSAPSPPRS
jgi:hypothetical protein